MQSFFEYIQARPAALPDPVTMLNRLGIDFGGPSEVEVLRLVKRMKAAERAGTKGGVVVPSTTRSRRLGPAGV